MLVSLEINEHYLILLKDKSILVILELFTNALDDIFYIRLLLSKSVYNWNNDKITLENVGND